MSNRSLILPIGILAGGIIGAGVFALPYAVSQSGIIPGLGYLALAAIAYSIIHLMYADIMLRTLGEHRFVGYAERYLGPSFRLLTTAMAVVEMLFVLTIYLILSKSFSGLIVPGAGSELLMIVFWLFGSAAIFLSLKRLAFSETVVTFGMLAIIAILFILGLPHLERFAALPLFGAPVAFLLPLPAILFALSGRVAIPSVVDYFKKRHVAGAKNAVAGLRRTIWIGTVLPALAYAIFIIGVIGLSPEVSSDAVSGLVGQVPLLVLGLIGILGWLSLWSSYLLVGLDVFNTVHLDLKVPNWIAGLSVISIPMALYLFGFDSFLVLVSIVGGIFLSLEGIFIIVMWLRLNRLTNTPPAIFSAPRPITIKFLVLVFVAALIAVLFG